MKTKTFFCLCLIIGIAITPLSGQISKNGDDNIPVKYTGVYSDYCQPVHYNGSEVNNLSGTLTYSDSTNNEIAQSRSQRGFYLGALYSGISNPTFRYPSGGEELAVKQSASSLGFLAGYQYDFERFGLGARAIYWHASFEDFNSEDMPGSQHYVNYANPALTHISFDLLVEWIATKKFFVGIYGLMGMASSTESYNISGSDFPEWNDQKSLTEFDYSYGFGIKISPLKLVSVITEIRWIPGDGTQELDFLYSSGGYNYYNPGDEYTKNHTTILSLGLTFHFGTFKNNYKLRK
jgi:hypothetical protein